MTRPKKEYCEKELDTTEDEKKVLELKLSDSETAIEELEGSIATLAEELEALEEFWGSLPRSMFTLFETCIEPLNVRPVLEQQPENLKALVRRMIALEPLEKYEAALDDARSVLRACPGHDVANRMQHLFSGRQR